MDCSQLSELQEGNIILKKVTENDKIFVREMFKDHLVRKYYIVTEDVTQKPDYNSLFNKYVK